MLSEEFEHVIEERMPVEISYAAAFNSKFAGDLRFLCVALDLTCSGQRPPPEN